MPDDVNASWDEVMEYCANREENVAEAVSAMAEGVVVFGAGPHGQARSPMSCLVEK